MPLAATIDLRHPFATDIVYFYMNNRNRFRLRQWVSGNARVCSGNTSPRACSRRLLARLDLCRRPARQVATETKCGSL